MNREIDFIAFDPKSKTRYKVIEINFETKEVHITNDTYDLWVDIDDIILMQFTGLYDNKGKKIYEGDVLPIFGQNHAVKFQNGRFTIKDKSITRFQSSIPLEVIGNIYETPELLNKK